MAGGIVSCAKQRLVTWFVYHSLFAKSLHSRRWEVPRSATPTCLTRARSSTRPITVISLCHGGCHNPCNQERRNGPMTSLGTASTRVAFFQMTKPAHFCLGATRSIITDIADCRCPGIHALLNINLAISDSNFELDQ